MLAALTLRPAAEVSTMGTDVCAAACEKRAAGRACSPTFEATTTLRSGIRSPPRWLIGARRNRAYSV
jgi:hypothetical protein